MSPDVQTFFDEPTGTATHLVSDPATRTAAIIDPVLDFDQKSGRLGTHSADAILAAAAEQGLTLAYVLETHVHADHLSATDHIRRRSGATAVIGSHITTVQRAFVPVFDADDVATDGSQFDVLMADGDTLPLGALTIRALHTPGHTPACVTYLIGDAAFVGDTLFMPDYGTARCDFPGGDARTLFRSIRKILSLPADTRLYVGHDYLTATRHEHAWQTSVAEQSAANLHIHDGVSEDDFVALREGRDKTLSTPALLLPALQVNIRAGALPPPAPTGHIFLKLPVTLA
jgi:glyoxylase-like metal-dependent hydrolase (beta-lactamase superfamily II)